MFCNFGYWPTFFYIEWIFLICLDLFLHVFEHIHCFFGCATFWFTLMWCQKGCQKYIANTPKDAHRKSFSCNVFSVDLTLAVREFSQKLCSKANLSTSALLEVLRFTESVRVIQTQQSMNSANGNDWCLAWNRILSGQSQSKTFEF